MKKMMLSGFLLLSILLMTVSVGYSSHIPNFEKGKYTVIEKFECPGFASIALEQSDHPGDKNDDSEYYKFSAIIRDVNDLKIDLRTDHDRTNWQYSNTNYNFNIRSRANKILHVHRLTRACVN